MDAGEKLGHWRRQKLLPTRGQSGSAALVDASRTVSMDAFIYGLGLVMAFFSSYFFPVDVSEPPVLEVPPVLPVLPGCVAGG